MANTTKSSLISSLVPTALFPCLLSLALLAGTGTRAIGGRRCADNGENGYFDTEQGVATQDNSAVRPANASSVTNVAPNDKNEGPVRLARFVTVSGNVTWRPDETAQWSDAVTNLPLREGAQIWATDGARAEIQFDDGSVLRLGTGAIVTLQTFYSDSDGEFTEIKLNDGLATLRVLNSLSVFQVDTPLAAVKAGGPAEFRLGVGEGLEVAVQRGKVAVEGQQNSVSLAAGDYLEAQDPQAAFTVGRLPRKDSWDLWNDERDELLDDANQPGVGHLPPNIALVAGDLDDYGTWHNDPTYGYVWCPRGSDSGWRPYHTGHWTWVVPFGWTWVAAEPWGWAPYHYGAWVYKPYGWAWAPGPTQQYWCPAIVHFSEHNGQVAWCPLAPSEVRYPASLAVKFHAGNWATLFSIGQAGVYYVADRSYCVARPFNTLNVNQATYFKQFATAAAPAGVRSADPTSANLVQGSTVAADARRNAALIATGFVPVNAVQAAGASSARTADLAGHGGYIALPKGSQAYFINGKSAPAPDGDAVPFAGAMAAQATAAAMTPTGQFVTVAPPSALARRAVVASPLPLKVQQVQTTVNPAGPTAAAAGAGFAAINRAGITTLPARTTPPEAGRTYTGGQAGMSVPHPNSGPGSGQGGSPARSSAGAAPSPGNAARPGSAPAGKSSGPADHGRPAGKAPMASVSGAALSAAGPRASLR